MDYILICNIFNEPTLVKDRKGIHKGNDIFIKYLIKQNSNYDTNMPIIHGRVIHGYSGHYLVLDLKKITSPIDWNLTDIDPIDFMFINEQRIQELLKVELRDRLINEFL